MWNLGSGRGFSVFEIIKKFEEQLNIKFDLKILPRRKGDIAEYWSDIKKAKEDLNWSPVNNINIMIHNVLNFFQIIKNK